MVYQIITSATKEIFWCKTKKIFEVSDGDISKHILFIKAY